MVSLVLIGLQSSKGNHASMCMFSMLLQ